MKLPSLRRWHDTKIIPQPAAQHLVHPDGFSDVPRRFKDFRQQPVAALPVGCKPDQCPPRSLGGGKLRPAQTETRLSHAFQ